MRGMKDGLRAERVVTWRRAGGHVVIGWEDDVGGLWGSEEGSGREGEGGGACDC